MGMMTVSRRVVNIKMKKTRKPHVPMPKRPTADDTMVGEKAKPFSMMAAVPRAVPPQSWWQKAMRPAAITLGVLVCGGAYFVFNASHRPSYDRSAETASYSAASSPAGGVSRARGAQTSAYPGGESIKENIVLSDRTTPTDKSFLATAYVRKKVSLPNISGNCVVNGGGGGDVGECLRRQMEQ